MPWSMALVALLAAPAFAGPASLGTVANVEGVATVTLGDAGARVLPGIPVQDGMQFATAPYGTLTLRMDSGCTLVLPPEHSVVVADSMTCPDLHAAVRSYGETPDSQARAVASTVVVDGVIRGSAGTLAIEMLRAVVVDDEPLSRR